MEEEKKKYSWGLADFIVLLSAVLIFIFAFFVIPDGNEHDNRPQNSSNDIDKAIGNDYVILSRTSFIDGCNTLTGIKSVSLATSNNRFYTSSTLTPSKSPVKKIRINGDLGNVFLCVVPDISDKKPSYNNYRKGYNSNTVLKIGNFAGYYDVGWSVNSNQFYDYDSDNSTKVNTKMYGKYYTEELPYYQIIDMQQNLIFADKDNGGIQSINLRDQFNDGNELLVGGYMNKLGADAYWASSIREFRILWDGDGSIEIL